MARIGRECPILLVLNRRTRINYIRGIQPLLSQRTVSSNIFTSIQIYSYSYKEKEQKNLSGTVLEWGIKSWKRFISFIYAQLLLPLLPMPIVNKNHLGEAEGKKY